MLERDMQRRHRPSVRPSVTSQYHVNTSAHRIRGLHRLIANRLAFWTKFHTLCARVSPIAMASNKTGVVKQQKMHILEH